MRSQQLRATIEESIATKQRLLARCLPQIEALCALAVRTLQQGGKIMFCGNGGSACDAAHAAGELIGTFEDKQRKGYAAIALGHEVPALTAVANDMGYEVVFARQLEAIGRKGDLVVGFSTSGTSKNIVAALRKARELGIATAAMMGERPGPCSELADVALQVPSTNTARIQESHLLCVHLLCAAVEADLGSNRKP
jgi:D-sedoheptulose 7-phosphate isomerase